jgi:hypothetical protein
VHYNYRCIETIICVSVCLVVCLCAITMVISGKYYSQRILAVVRRNYEYVLQTLLLTVSTCYTFLLLTLSFHLYTRK